MNVIIACLAAVACFSLFAFILQSRREKHETVRKRLTRLGQEAPEERPVQDTRGMPVAFLRFVRVVAKHLRQIYKANDLDFKMLQADWPLLGSEFLVIIFVLGVMIGALLFLLTLQLLNFWLGIGLGLVLGFTALKVRINRRRRLFVEQLGDSLLMIANALRAGFSFLQAIELVSREMPDPLGCEFRRVIGEMNVGGSLENALGNMSRRMESTDFELIVTAVLIQRQVGGNLSQILDTISDTIRARIRMKSEIMTLTAQGRMSGMILLALPFLVCGFIIMVNPGYLQPMLQSDVGRIALMLGTILEFIGYILIRRIVDIENS